LSGLAILVGLPVVMAGTLSRRDIKVFGDLPPFALTERSGKEVTSDTLRGKVWVAGFIFTHCPTQCPRISARMAEVQQQLRAWDDFRLVSFTVDPDRDTPERLSWYASRWDASPTQWLFLTGKRRELSFLIQNGFRLASGEIDGSAGTDDISHSAKLVLVDRRGRLRGYYDSSDEDDLASLVSDAKRLMRKAE
jgi:protein SCO1/2